MVSVFKSKRHMSVLTGICGFFFFFWRWYVWLDSRMFFWKDGVEMGSEKGC